MGSRKICFWLEIAKPKKLLWDGFHAKHVRIFILSNFILTCHELEQCKKIRVCSGTPYAEIIVNDNIL